MSNITLPPPPAAPPACHQILATPPILSPFPPKASPYNNATISTNGILFTIANPTKSNLTISSLGFYLDNHKLFTYFHDTSNTTLSYQVYTLPGYYADPERRGVEIDPTAYYGGGLPVDAEWDYRGNFSYWALVGEGSFVWDDLSDVVNVDYLVNASYYSIPLEVFESVSIAPYDDGLSEGFDYSSSAPNATVQSFYLTILEVSALYQESLENWEILNHPQPMLDCGLQLQIDGRLEYDLSTSQCIDANQRDDLPIVQIGEGVVSYPFYTIPYFYRPRKFMGRIYLESNEICPTATPTHVPSEIPSFNANSSLTSLAPSPSSILSSDTYIDAKLYGCHRYISTDEEYSNFANQTSASYGIIFPIQSNELDGDGIWITSLGFYIDFDALVPHMDQEEDIIDYQVYTLINEGYYADPNRIRSDGTPIEYDYRGNFTYWMSIASGTISKSFLSFYSYNKQPNGDDVETYYFEIPWDRFTPTYIPPIGGVQSFYLTLNSGALIYRAVDPNQKNSIGKVQKDDNFQSNYDDLNHPPILLVGEGIIGYPFNTMPFLYNAKQFVGKVYYEIECPSESPSVSPSLSPSKSVSPSLIPSVEPSDMPSLIPSQKPSINPSTSVSPHIATLEPSASSFLRIEPGAKIIITILIIVSFCF